MTYWHMQMHQNDKNIQEEYPILERGIIGLGDWEDKKATSQITQFKDEMKIGDIVLIKRGERPLALVEVVSNVKEGEGVGGNKWIYYKRDIRLLDKDVSSKPSFPQPRGTLQKSINKYTRTYQYIDNWYKQYKNPNLKELGLKIKKVTIENYKMFKDFQIDFMDSKNDILPIVVIAGKNGTGKTTLLESILNRDYACIDFRLDGQDISNYNKVNELKNLSGDVLSVSEGTYEEILPDNIIYLDAMIENDNEIEKLMLAYIDYFIYDKNENAVLGVENLQSDMDEVFKNFELNFHFKKIDYKTKKPVFGNENSTRDDIEFSLQDLSTGERTLLSKMLYLHLREAKNKVIMIDEPETSLHPSWQNKILKFYENFAKINNCQIIIATHSPHIIGSAKNEYLRILRNDKNGNIEVINDVMAYGRDIEWVLEEVMGISYTREAKIIDKLKECEKLIEKEKYEEAEKAIDLLENIIGENDSEILTLRNSLAFERMNFEEDN